MKLSTLMQGPQITWEQPGEPTGATPNEPPVDGAGQTPADPGQAPEPPDFSWVPEAYKTDDGHDFTKLREDYDAGMAAKAQLDERAGTIPEDASGYEFAIPETVDFSDIEGLPENFTVQALTDSEVFKPLFDQLGEVMLKHGAPTEMAGEMMGLLARYKATEVADGMKSAKAELEKVPNWESRLSTVGRALDARLPAEHATALKGSIHSADALKALEKLVSPGGAKTSPPSPAASGLNDVNDPYERLKRARGAA